MGETARQGSRCYHSPHVDRIEWRRKLLADEPRLAAVASGALDAFTAPIVDAAFAKEMRSLLGHDALPDPINWVFASPSSGELAVRQTLAVGKLQLRRWEGKLELFRSRSAPLERILAPIFFVHLRERTREDKPDEDSELVEWEGGAAFARILAWREGRTILLRLVPALELPTRDLAHEDEAARVKERGPRQLPSPTALPCGIALPKGGRYAKRSRPARKRAK
jgi:hypothetical protein